MDTIITDSQNNRPAIKITQELTTSDVKEQIGLTWPKEYTDKKVWGIPRGGYNIALLLENMKLAKVVEDPDTCDIVVDDIVDSGRTRDKFLGIPFYAPYMYPNKWIVFPWEKSFNEDADELIVRYLQMIGEDPTREGLKETPARVVKSWKELYSGYGQDPKDILCPIFETNNDSLVICKDIEFYSMCEHHILPFFGKAHIGYIPRGRVVGLSKLARLVDIYARRLQIQEQLTNQIAEAMVQNIESCEDAMVVIEAKHMCMCSRGVNKQQSIMTTSAIRGVFKGSDVRAEFLTLIK